MGFKFNPFSGNFDQTGSGGGGGGSAFFAGEVATYADLPLDGTAALNSRWLVRSNSGTWPFSSYKQAGVYVRTATGGTDRGADYTLTDTSFHDVMSDSAFVLFDDGDATKNLKFQLSGIDTATTRTLTAPNASGTIARTEDFAAPPAIGSTTRNSGAFTTLNANNGTLTASAPVLDLAQTWNNAAVTFTGLRFNVTNTASAAASNIADFQVGGTSIVSIGRDGFIGSANAGINVRSTGSLNRLSFFSQGGTRLLHNNSILLNESDGGYGWVTSGAPSSLAFDTGIFRGGAGIIEQRNGANAQAYRLYNTTDAGLTNFERGFIGWSSNTLRIGTEAGGTGSARALEFQTGGSTRIAIAADGFTVFNNNVSVTSGRVLAANQINLNATSTALLALGTDSTIRWGSSSATTPMLKRSSTTLQVRLADDSADAPLSAASITLGAGTATAPSFSASGSALGIYQRQVGELALTDGLEPQARYFANNIIFNSDFAVGWGNSTTAPTGLDTILRRDAAGIVAQYNGVNPQGHRLYNTFTSANNFERLSIRWSSNECIIDTEIGGSGGTLRGIKIGSATSSLLGFYGATPVDRPAAVADPTGGGTVDTEARTAINDLIDRLQELGLIA